jgi:hypothetical protein
MEDRLAIGARVYDFIRSCTLRRLYRKDDEAFTKGNKYQSLIDVLYMVDDKYKPPPGASRNVQMALAKKYRSKITPEAWTKHTKDIQRELRRAIVRRQNI